MQRVDHSPLMQVNRRQPITTAVCLSAARQATLPTRNSATSTERQSGRESRTLTGWRALEEVSHPIIFSSPFPSATGRDARCRRPSWRSWRIDVG